MCRAPAVRARPAAAAELTGAVRGEAHRALAALYADRGGALLRYAMHLTGGPASRRGCGAGDHASCVSAALAGPPVRAWLFTVARHGPLTSIVPGRRGRPKS